MKKTDLGIRLFLIFWLILIFYFSHQPRLKIPGPEIPGRDKIIHAGVYSVLGALALRSLKSLPRRFWVAGVLGTLYGISDEFHQQFVHGRCFEVADMLADAFGSFFGAFLMNRYLSET